jgi:hypothetical protein
MSSIPRYSSLFEKTFPLSSFIACYFLTNYSLESQLEMWEYRILIDDKQTTNIDKLSPHELVSSLYSCGIYFHLNEMGKVLKDQQTIIISMDSNS